MDMYKVFFTLCHTHPLLPHLVNNLHFFSHSHSHSFFFSLSAYTFSHHIFLFYWCVTLFLSSTQRTHRTTIPSIRELIRRSIGGIIIWGVLGEKAKEQQQQQQHWIDVHCSQYSNPNQVNVLYEKWLIIECWKHIVIARMANRCVNSRDYRRHRK